MPKRVTYAVKEIEKAFLSVTELYAYTGISPDVQERLRKEGLLVPYYLYGVRKIMYKKKDIDRDVEKYRMPERRSPKLKLN